MFPKLKSKINDMRAKRKYSEEDNEYNCGGIRFVWGVKAGDDHSLSEEASLYTMNDIDICYDTQKEVYYLGVETIYNFKHGRKGQIAYYDRLLREFTKFMEDNEYDVSVHESECIIEPIVVQEAKTITELYTMFRIFVEGFKVIYGGDLNESV